MSLETRTYVITAESSVLDELEGVLKMAQAQIGSFQLLLHMSLFLGS